jgi:2-phosphosulfolactate phosphatase
MAEEYLRVHTLPTNVRAEDLAASTVVVIDVLRATTTICQALDAGATEVVPFLEVWEAQAAAEKAGRENVVLGGERRGARIDGFDLGNSPAEYTPDAVGGKSVYITTTNGTRALYHARLARRIVVGAMVNLSSVVESVIREPRIDILCAGTDGEETLEDLLAAGAMIERLTVTPLVDWQLNDAASNAAREWRMLVGKADLSGRSIEMQLAEKFRDTLGGRNCIEVGNAADLPECARIDHVRVAPEMDTKSGRITVPTR